MFRTMLKTACLFSLIGLAGCDADVDDSDLATVEVEASPRAPSELAAVDAEDDPEDMSVDASLDRRDAEDDETAASCWTGQQDFKFYPSGTCGGCVISGSYPGQNFIKYYRYCYNGTWGPWEKSTQCEHC